MSACMFHYAETSFILSKGNTLNICKRNFCILHFETGNLKNGKKYSKKS